MAATPQGEPTPVTTGCSMLRQGIGIPLVVQDRGVTGVHGRRAEPAHVGRVRAWPASGPPPPRRLLQGMKSARAVLTGLKRSMRNTISSGSSGFNTASLYEVRWRGEAMRALTATFAGARFLPLIVFEQQPGVAVRREMLRLRGLIKRPRTSSRRRSEAGRGEEINAWCRCCRG